ncbi:HRDC multi-domain protein [Pyrenophora tritici-repentis]|uniref:HRDC multi-domain protein n=1 Tax=Pyrenophora tritici-repentis TaxID=45151 RepID=A0A922NRC2_9PLEO|nr:HRDC multi-domain protein [Pyrenophora tritici-repentis]PZD01617.1 HRDC multi-domain protein [Pyrenophora tritici-repentis]
MATLTPAVEPQWPCSFRLPENQDPNRRTFSPRLFRGPDNQPPQEFYSDNYDDSEKLASMFLNESVLGFDMQWIYPERKNNIPLQEAVSVIGVATESKIAVFHIGRHLGKRASEVLAPSLRKIIENRDIVKTGYSIIGDLARLRKHFGLQPRGAMELSYLNVLINEERMNFKTYYTKGGMGGLVNEHFHGYTLIKDSGQRKDWLSPMTANMKSYAAADPYAGIMLYYPYSEDYYTFEEFLKKGFLDARELRLQPLHPGGNNPEAKWFFSMAEDHNVPKNLDPVSKNLYKLLLDGRDKLANHEGLHPREMIIDCALRTMALTRPQTAIDCEKLRGLNDDMRKDLAEYFSQIITKFERELQKERIKAAQQETAQPPQEPGTPNPSTPSSEPDAAIIKEEDSEGGATDEAPAPAAVPAMHTGLTFNMADTALDGDVAEGAGKEIKVEPVEPTEENKKWKRMRDQGLEEGGKKKEPRRSTRKRSG